MTKSVFGVYVSFSMSLLSKLIRIWFVLSDQGKIGEQKEERS